VCGREDYHRRIGEIKFCFVGDVLLYLVAALIAVIYTAENRIAILLQKSSQANKINQEGNHGNSTFSPQDGETVRFLQKVGRERESCLQKSAGGVSVHNGRIWKMYEERRQPSLDQRQRLSGLCAERRSGKTVVVQCSKTS
jgi:hypothetical protein